MAKLTGTGKALVVLGALCIVGGVLIMSFAIGNAVAVNTLLNGSELPISIGIGFLVSLAVPCIIPGILAVLAGLKPEGYGLLVAFLVLDIIGMLWLFGQTVGLFVLAALLRSQASYSEEMDQDNNVANFYMTVYALSVTAGVVALLCCILQLAASIIACTSICSDSHTAQQHHMVVTSGGFSIPATASYQGHTTTQVIHTGYPMTTGGYPTAMGGYPPAMGGYPPAMGGYPTENAPQYSNYPTTATDDQVPYHPGKFSQV